VQTFGTPEITAASAASGNHTYRWGNDTGNNNRGHVAPGAACGSSTRGRDQK
jgi:hypothetical protein